MNYFNKFPLTYHNGFPAVNIMARASLSRATRRDKLVFYPYTLQEGMERADVLANAYYDTPGLAWLVWMANDVVDPYYSVNLNSLDFYNYITKKYGTYELAARKIAFYRNNWVSDQETVLTIQQYDTLTSGINATLSKYYTNVFDNFFNTVGYRRLRVNTVVNTNKTVRLAITFNDGTAFTKGEEILQSSSIYAFCTASDSESVIVQHVTGQYTVGAPIIGRESGTIATITDITTLSISIPDGTNDTANEVPYWSPITYLEYEEELNNRKKEIQLIDSRYSVDVNEQLTSLMRR